MTDESWRNASSMVTLVKSAYECAAPHQRAQIRQLIQNSSDNVGFSDTQYLNWMLENCDITNRANGKKVARRNQVKFQLKKSNEAQKPA
jgi:hypothetical protein